MSPADSAAVATTAIYAVNAHRAQVLKDGVTPYIVHPARVAALVMHFGGSPDALIAAWLHDVIENRYHDGVSIVDAALASTMLPGDRQETIRAMIFALTKNPKIPDKDDRLDDSLRRILIAPPEAVLVKICDRIDNLLEARTRDPEFRIRYSAHTKRITGILAECAGSHGYGPALDLMERIRVGLDMNARFH